jgi:hypothetical protein
MGSYGSGGVNVCSPAESCSFTLAPLPLRIWLMLDPPRCSGTSCILNANFETRFLI